MSGAQYDQESMMRAAEENALVLGAVSDGLGGWYFGAVNRAS